MKNSPSLRSNKIKYKAYNNNEHHLQMFTQFYTYSVIRNSTVMQNINLRIFYFIAGFDVNKHFNEIGIQTDNIEGDSRWMVG